MHRALHPRVARTGEVTRNRDRSARRAWRERQQVLRGNGDSDLQRRFADRAAARAAGIPSVQEVAIDLHLSPRRLRQLCTGWFGFPPKVILEISACESIAQQLLETDAPLKDIALGKGFREPAAFNRFFKRVTGESPGRYRASRASRTPPGKPCT
jgi:AraC-like DNA-binding protein